MRVGTLFGMTSERVTISLPAEVRDAAQRVAEAEGLAFSTVVSAALTGWLRNRLVDVWLHEHQREVGVFDESELRTLAAEVGVPYLPPRTALPHAGTRPAA
jgi:hypothetical protein